LRASLVESGKIKMTSTSSQTEYSIHFDGKKEVLVQENAEEGKRGSVSAETTADPVSLEQYEALCQDNDRLMALLKEQAEVNRQLKSVSILVYIDILIKYS